MKSLIDGAIALSGVTFILAVGVAALDTRFMHVPPEAFARASVYLVLLAIALSVKPKDDDGLFRAFAS